jgi:hypothetical protein
MVAQENNQLPALESGNAGSWILHRISGFDQQNFSKLFAQGFSREATPKAL